jgi:acetoin utilization protein AcuB
MNAEDVMIRSVVTATPADTVRTAIQLLEEQDIRHLPIVDEGRLVGMVSDRDLREYRLAFLEEPPDGTGPLMSTPLATVMQGDVVACHLGDSLRDAIDQMLEYRVGCVPVVDLHTDELVGVISYVDVLRELRTTLD